MSNKLFLLLSSRRDFEPVSARIICAKLACGYSAQMIAVAEQQQEVLYQEGRDSEPVSARIIGW